MQITRHKLFKLKVSDDGKFTITKAVEKTLNNFLSDPNNVYVNHSITTLSEDVSDYGNIKTVCRYILISVVYKDLNSSSLDVKGTSNKMKKIVHKQLESGAPIEEPLILTDLDKEIIEFENRQ